MKLINSLKKLTLPGFKKVPTYLVLNDLYGNISDAYFWLRASALSYSFFFAVFPTIILLTTLIPYIPIPDLDKHLQTFLKEKLPPDAYQLIHLTVAGVFIKQGFGIISLTFVIVVFSATRGVSTLIQAFSKSDSIHFKKRSFWKDNLLSFYIFLILFLLVLLNIIIVIVGEMTFNYFQYFNNINIYGYKLLLLINSSVSLLIFYFAISFLYYQAPSTRTKWKLFSTGAFIASLFIFLAQLGLRYYFTNFAAYNKIYGSLTAVMILMVWFYWNSICLLLGFELNVSIDKALHNQQTISEK